MKPPPKPLLLVIEDDEDTRGILDQELSPSYQLVFARDGREGVRAAIFHRPNLILMDLIMPAIDGISATEMIRSIKGLQYCAIVALTAAPVEYQRRALESGCDLVIQKPAHDLPGQLQRFLASRSPGPPPTA